MLKHLETAAVLTGPERKHMGTCRLLPRALVLLKELSGMARPCREPAPHRALDACGSVMARRGSRQVWFGLDYPVRRSKSEEVVPGRATAAGGLAGKVDLGGVCLPLKASTGSSSSTETKPSPERLCPSLPGPTAPAGTAPGEGCSLGLLRGPFCSTLHCLLILSTLQRVLVSSLRMGALGDGAAWRPNRSGSELKESWALCDRNFPE